MAAEIISGIDALFSPGVDGAQAQAPLDAANAATATATSTPTATATATATDSSDAVSPEGQDGGGGGGGDPPSTAAATLSKEAGLERFVATEIERRLLANGSSWRKLDLCFKWRYLQEYLQRRGAQAGSPEHDAVRALLRSGELNAVDFDGRERRVVRINHAECAALDA